MRASTIFALIIAILLGLGVAIAVRASGILAPSEPKKEAPMPMILVAATNLLEGNYLQPTDVKLRPARNSQELEALNKNELLPPLTQAVNKRIARVPIPADAPIRKEYLEDLTADNLKNRLLPCERAVNCCIHKQYCAGGLIQVGDLVDVMLITTIEGDGTVARAPEQNTYRPVSATNQDAAAATGQNAAATIVRNARVIARRNSLYPVNTPLGPDCCVNYTLAMNPYRAGLTEFAKDKGVIALLPLSEMERRLYEQEQATRLGGNVGRGVAGLMTTPRSADGTVPASAESGGITATRPWEGGLGGTSGVLPCRYSIPGNPEYQDEDERVEKYAAGLYAIGEHDLARIFGLKYVPRPQPPQPSRVESFVGVKPAGEHVFDNIGRSIGFLSADGPTGRDNGGSNAKVTPIAATSNQRGGTVQLVSAESGIGRGASYGGSAFRFRPPDASCLPAPTQPVVVRRRG